MSPQPEHNLSTASGLLRSQSIRVQRLGRASIGFGILLALFTIFMGSRHACDEHTTVLASLSDVCVMCIGGHNPWRDRVQATVYTSGGWYFVADYDVTTRGWNPVGVAWCTSVPERYGLWVPSVERWDRSLMVEMADGSAPSISDAAMIRAEFHSFLSRRTKRRPVVPFHYAEYFQQGATPLWHVDWLCALLDAAFLLVALLWMRLFLKHQLLRRRMAKWSKRIPRGQCPICAYTLDSQHIGCPECGWLREPIR